MNRIIYACFSAISVLIGSHTYAACSHHLLVSGYFSNNVAIFDACSGDFLRNLDSASRIVRPQAVHLTSDGLLYVVSEGNDRILRYRASDYSFLDTFAQLGASVNPTGVAVGEDDHVYVGGYGSDSVLRLDGQNGSVLSVVIAPGSGLVGPDNGLGFGPDGFLYVPGYESDNISRVNPISGALQANFVAPRSGGLNEPRGILFESNRTSFLVSGEGSGAIYRYRLSDGALMQTLITGLSRPTGMAFAPDGSLLVFANPGSVYRFNAQTGAALGTLLNASAAGVSGGTYLTLVPNPELTVDATQIGSQYWVFGSGSAGARSLDVELFSATGAEFGPAFDPDSIVRKRWGSLNLTFTACDRANFRYDSTGDNSANFGAFSYDVVRLIDSDATIACRNQGFAAATGRAWMTGTWYQPQRSGEGVLLEVAADGTVVASYFTHVPRGF